MTEKAYQIGSNLVPLTPTPQHFHEVTVTYHNLQLKSPFHISFIGDEHDASPEHLTEFNDYAINRINKRKNASYFQMGDAHENNHKDSPGYSQFSQTKTNEESQDCVKKRHKPINKKCWIWHEGNHGGERSRNKTGISDDKNIAEILDVPYSRISAYHIIDFNNHRLVIYTNHGKKRATPTWRGTLNKIKKESLIYNEADIIAIGHIHKLRYVPIELDENIIESVVINYENQCMDTRPVQNKKLLITGHFMDYLGGYGQKDGYAPEPAGYPILVLNPNGSYDIEKVMYRDFEEGLL